MASHNPNNERIKRQYFAYLKEARRYSESTVDGVAKALDRFEVHTKHRDFKKFHIEQAIAFKKYLAGQKGQRSGKALSKATLNATLAHLKRFFHWLAGQPGYRSRLKYSDGEYFNLSEKDMRVATARRELVGPTVEQVKHVIRTMPAESVVERRDRAVVAFIFLTGARDRAVASMSLKHVDLVAGSVEQDAREVQTKFSKSFTTFFFPVGNEIFQIIEQWILFLREEMLCSNDDPLFSATGVKVGESGRFERAGLSRTHWKNAARIRAIFREAFTAAGLRYFNPHSIRNTLARLGQTTCQTPEELKAWSQNLGHEKVLTTFLSYGQVETSRQGEIIRGLASPRLAGQPDVREIAKAVMQEIRSSGGGTLTE